MRTGERSRAEVVLVSGTIIKLGPLSDLVVPPTEQAVARRGIFQIFNRERSKEGVFGLPGAVAAIRGTDFLVEISDTGQIALSVLDGAVTLSNQLGHVDLATGDRGSILPGQAPVRSRIDLNDPSLIQWSFYYPAVLDIAELSFAADEREPLRESLAAYREGDLPNAYGRYPWSRSGGSGAERAYRSALLLSVGEVEKARRELEDLSGIAPGKQALTTLISAVRMEGVSSTNAPTGASAWLAESYARQARADLSGAREAARQATSLAPNLGFAWTRLAELEFSFGQRKAAQRALDHALNLSPRNAHAVALGGFLEAAAGHIETARQTFDRAINLDSSYANGWFGRGLCLIRQRADEAGERDLFIACTLEPQRAVYRSYLGKAFQEIRDDRHARRELDIAKRLDAHDPTAWLYSALQLQQENRNSEAVRDLEYAQSVGAQRGLFRSPVLLDEDRAVRGANLAAIYKDAGLTDASLREAAEAVNQDYASFSAHLFLANSYNQLRDASLGNLRYETATFSEYLMANLLSPVGGTPLSQQVSQQEYSRLFERNRLGLSTETTYLSNGQWQQSAAQYGVWGNFAYSLEGTYSSLPGEGPNSDLDQRAFSLQLKEQVTPDDSAYFQAVYNRLDYGDVFQHYDPEATSRTLRNHELQEPNLFGGWHHQWAPGVHTLLLLSDLRDDFKIAEPNGRVNALIRDGSGTVTNTMAGIFGAGTGDAFGVDYRSKFEVFGAELQQIWHAPSHTIVAGFRAQTGQVDTQSLLTFRGGLLPGLYYATDHFSGSLSQNASSDFNRYSGYGYWQWQVADPFSIFAGLTVDEITFPENNLSAPISDQDREKSQLSPKAGFSWRIDSSSTVRGAYSRSLGGLFYDGSVRLEPVQVAGYNQVFRSIAPESIAGLAPGTEFDAYDIGSEHRLRSHTYFGWQAELLQSRADRPMGVFAGTPSNFFTLAPAQIDQELRYRERSLSLYANQLLGDGWSIGSRYRLSDSAYKLSTPSVASSAWADGNSDQAALLHQVNLYVLYNHPSGWFAGADGVWTRQENARDDAGLGSEDFWQFNCQGGYRWPRRRAELAVGLLNITGQDYRLNPVSLYARLPRDRTLFSSLRLNF